MTSEDPKSGAADNARYVIGVDVGTGSARAGIFDLAGRMVASAKHDITLFHASGSIVEQSSSEIWQAVCTSVREALSQSALSADEIAGIGFDATCSLVVLGEGGRPLPVGPSEQAERDIIVWMDHRALDQAERINAGGHEVLKYVGGKISPEMETPKLLWLLENRPHIFAAAWQFFDLTDFLTWRATGDLSRSTCTVTCKWTYLAHERRWDENYFQAVGLGVLADEAFARIGQTVVDPGTPLGSELFGYEEGAFTGARRGGKAGLIESAHRGTLFLDEIGEMPLPLQSRLLRVLQEREVVRLGSTEPLQVDVRIVAATHRALSERMKAGEFRADLFYRLNILNLHLPPLRERAADIAALAAQLLWRTGRVVSFDAALKALDPVMPIFTSYAWPGNVRELQNVIERISLELEDPAAKPLKLTPRLIRSIAPELEEETMNSNQESLKARSRKLQADEIRTMLDSFGGDRGRTAKALGISKTTLWRKLTTR
ncbi:sigma 54-interacting transcriptional regulator [Caballeronia sp. M23-90]